MMRPWRHRSGTFGRDLGKRLENRRGNVEMKSFSLGATQRWAAATSRRTCAAVAGASASASARARGRNARDDDGPPGRRRRGGDRRSGGAREPRCGGKESCPRRRGRRAARRAMPDGGVARSAARGCTGSTKDSQADRAANPDGRHDARGRWRSASATADGDARTRERRGRWFTARRQSRGACAPGAVNEPAGGRSPCASSTSASRRRSPAVHARWRHRIGAGGAHERVQKRDKARTPRRVSLETAAVAPRAWRTRWRRSARWREQRLAHDHALPVVGVPPSDAGGTHAAGRAADPASGAHATAVRAGGLKRAPAFVPPRRDAERAERGRDARALRRVLRRDLAEGDARGGRAGRGARMFDGRPAGRAQ